MFSSIQFAAVMVMTLLTMILAVLPQRVARNRMVDRSRWLMMEGTFLLAVHFALQYKLQLRTMGATQAVMLNLPFFIFVSILLSSALLYLQRRSSIRRHEWLVGAASWVATVAMLAIAAAANGGQILSDTPQIRLAEREQGASSTH